jgi:hypothetical protein
VGAVDGGSVGAGWLPGWLPAGCRMAAGWLPGWLID